MTREDLEALLLRLPEPATPLKIRDRAIALLTFATSRRRSEIAALDLAHVTFRHQNDHDFLLVRIAKSKSDQHGVGATVAVPRLGEQLRRICAVRALVAWLEVIHAYDDRVVVGEGPIFRAFSITSELQSLAIGSNPGRLRLLSSASTRRPAIRKNTSAPSRRTRCGVGSSPRPTRQGRRRLRS